MTEPTLLSGRGAGDMPTAVSVVADVLDVARARMSGSSSAASPRWRMLTSIFGPAKCWRS